MDKERQNRLLEETQQVAGRLNALHKFMASDEFPRLPREDKDLLYEQHRAMSVYVQILGKRLERTGRVFEHDTSSGYREDYSNSTNGESR